MFRLISTVVLTLVFLIGTPPSQAQADKCQPRLSCAPVTTDVCQEDMPCWDCATMGNRVCGPSIGNALGRFPV